MRSTSRLPCPPPPGSTPDPCPRGWPRAWAPAMRTGMLALLFALCAPRVPAAGVKLVQLPADSHGPALKAMVWTPCAAPAQPLPIGPYVLQGQRNCPTRGRKLPLVVMSHGFGGSYLGQHDLAEVLADSGFVVAAINHPGDNFAAMRDAGRFSVLVERPLDIKRLIDYLLGSGPDAASLDPAAIGFFGFSRGGYTGLVLAGGTPDFLHANLPCPDPRARWCAQIRRRQIPDGPWIRDPRIKAYALADPLDAFPGADRLKAVNAPMQLWASAYGGDGVLPATTPALAALLPVKPELHRVPGAGHFAFLAPCSAALKQDAPALCVDAPGFDRVAFHRAFNQAVRAFFQRQIGGGQKQDVPARPVGNGG